MKKKYTLITFFLIIVVLVVVSFLTYQNLKNYIDEVTAIRHSNSVLRTLEMTVSSLKDAEAGHRGYLLTHDSTFLDPYHKSVKEIPVLVEELDSLLADNQDQVRRLDSLKILINDHLSLIPQILASNERSTRYMDPVETRLLFRGKQNMDFIRVQAKNVINEELIVRENRLQKEIGFKWIAPLAILTYTLLAIGALAILIYRLVASLRQREEAEKYLYDANEGLQAEVKVREFTQILLQSVLENSHNGIMAFQSMRNDKHEIEDFRWILANKTSMLAANIEESLVGKQLLQVMPGNREEGLFDFYKDVVENGLTTTTEKHYSGENLNKWFSITAAKLGDGFMVTFSDTTAAKQQIITLKERELLLKEAELLANMGSWKWTQKTNKMVWSEGLGRILGNTSEGKNSWEAFIECAHTDDKETLRTFITNAMKKLEGFRMEYRCLVKGEIRNFYISVTAETEIEKGNVLGAVVDITELKQTERELSIINNDLRRSNEDLEQFAYVASHDLQEPLRKIRAFGDLLVAKYSTQIDDTGTDYIQRMQSAAARMQTLIHDLLTFSRVSRKSLNPQQVDVNLIVAEVVDDLELQILRESATIQVGKLSSLVGDTIQLKRLFQNLISNAIKFHKKNEHPRVTIQSAPLTMADQQKYFPAATRDTKYVCITVEDNGIGFDPQYAEQIFQIFQRLHGRMEYEGTGIGLAVCKKIVDNHRGIIIAEGEESIGSKFIVILPID